MIEPIRYKIVLHKKVVTEDNKRFDEKTKQKIKAKIKELLTYHPEDVGKPLRFGLKDYRVLKIFNEYRIVYQVEHQKVIVFILAVGIRRDEEVYREAFHRLAEN